MSANHRRPALRLLVPVLMVLAALVGACGAGGGSGDRAAATPTPPAVGWYGEIEDASYVAYERVSLERLPRARLEPAEELRLAEQVRRVPAYRLRDGGDSAIRYTDDGGKGWLAWEPSVVLRVRRDFARAEGGQAGAVTTLGVARVQWPDSCIGVPLPERPCRAEPTPGFRVTVRLGAVTAVYHTDLGDQVLRARA
jgi:hypothetical protein